MIGFFLQLKVLLLLGLITFLILGLVLKKTPFKIVSYNFAAVLFCFFIYEAFLLNRGERAFYRLLDKKTKSYYKSSSNSKLLGYRVLGDLDLLGLKTKGQDTIFSANYTVRDNWRVTPNTNKSANRKVIFLGCSHTFGEGREDNETLPFFFNFYANNEFEVANYAFGGYGTHQAITITDSILLKNNSVLKAADSTWVVYNFFNYHVTRAAGNMFWDKNGPWYVLENDSVKYKGRFSAKPRPSIGSRLLKRFWFDSKIYKRHFFKADQYPQGDIDVTLALIKKMKTDLNKNGFKFLLIVDKRAYNDPIYRKPLEANNIQMVCLECEIEDFPKNKKYKIPGDGHETALFNKVKGKILAKYFADSLKS
jgi:hypothetical protein